MRYLLLLTCIFFAGALNAQEDGNEVDVKDSAAYKVKGKAKTLFGVASYYAEKFNGRKTANGETYDGTKLTAACNTLPLGTWIRVTNLSNNRSVIVKTNDRLHPRMTRIVDLSRAAAQKLGYISKGLTKVKVEVLEKKG